MRRTALLIPALGALLAACGAGPEPAIRELPLPASFGEPEAGPSSGAARWRDWFADERLGALLGEALAGNQDVLSARQRIEVTRAGVQAATGALLPKLSAGAGASVTKFGRYTMDGAGNTGTAIAPGQDVPVHLPNYTIGLHASWEVDLWGRLRGQREAAIARYLASVEGTNLVLSSLVGDVASTYFDLLALDHTRDVLRRSVARQAEVVDVVRLQKEAGRANELAVQQLEAQLAETRAGARAVEQRIVETENRLNVLLGRYPQAVERRRDALFDEPPRRASAGVPSELLHNRPDVRAAELLVQASKGDVRAARAAFFPSLSITADLGYEAFHPAYLFRTPESLAYSVGGGILAPLLNRSGLEAQLAGARAEQRQAMYAYQRAILGAFVEVANALADLRATEEVLSLRKEQKAATEHTVETADTLYRAGKAAYLEILLAQQSALRADLDLIEAWRLRRLAQVMIYKALGGGWR